MLQLRSEALKVHRENKGKLGVCSKVGLKDVRDLSLAYSPGVAEPCKEIFENEKEVYTYTIKGNLVAVVTDGTAVLGLGNIGPQAAMPVMEGKALLFKAFADVDAFPICLNTTDVDEIVAAVKWLEPTFGGINLEDISAPRCFEIEQRLRAELTIPVFHDDQHGTAIVTAAGLVNALKLVNKSLGQIRVVVNGAGAAGIAIVKLLHTMGVEDIILCDTKGTIYKDRPAGMNKIKDEVAQFTNKEQKKGTLADVMRGSDVFIGVSVEGAIDTEMVKSMNTDSIIFAMANPMPEIMPEEAIAAGAKVIGTGRSDFPNQINNVLAFPGIFRGTLDVRASEINEEMKIAAVYAIASLISESELKPEFIIPNPFDPRVAAVVSESVKKAAIESGVARIELSSLMIRGDES